MAKIKLGGLAQDARGSLNGTTFSRNRSGAYARAKASPVQPRTVRQLAQRAIFSAVSQEWRNLADAERASWEAWATTHPVTDVFGDAQILSGNAAYLLVNANRQTLGLPSSDTPPPDPTNLPPAAVSATAVASTGVVTVTLATAAVVTDLYQFWTTQGRSLGAGFANSMLTLAFSGKAVADVDQEFTPTAFNPRLGFVAGQRVTVLVVRYSNEGLVIDSQRIDVVAS
jgi:hypothetical protein